MHWKWDCRTAVSCRQRNAPGSEPLLPGASHHSSFVSSSITDWVGKKQNMVDHLYYVQFDSKVVEPCAVSAYLHLDC